MEFITQPTHSTTELTSEVAQAIYTLIKTYGSADLAFKNQPSSQYDPEHFVTVDAEGDRLIGEINTLMSGSKVITPAVPAVVGEDGEITSEAVPAVYYEPTTEADLLAQLSSGLLDVEDVLDDQKGEMTWTQFKNSFSQGE
jgi:hypothetical protein